MSATASAHSTAPSLRPGSAVPSRRRPRERGIGFFAWVLADVRHNLAVALVFLVAAPLAAGALLLKASSADQEFTSTIPLTVYDYSRARVPLEGILESTFANIAELGLADPSAFRRSHHWERRSGSSLVKQELVSVLVTKDAALARQTHREFLLNFTGAAAAMHPRLTFEVGDHSAEGAGLVVDDSKIHYLTRCALWMGVGFYLAGLALVVCACGRARLRGRAAA